MDFNKGARKSFVERLDSTAEKNPLLWIPCVTLLAAISGAKRIASDISTVLAAPEETGSAVSFRDVSSDKPVFVRTLSAFLAASMLVTFTPGLNGIAVTRAFAEEPGIETEAVGQTVSRAISDQGTLQNIKAATLKNKRDIKITLNCLLKGMTAGNAHATISKSYLDNSADVWLVSSDASRKDAEAVMIQLGENAAYYVCYPFEISIYDSDSKEPVDLSSGGSAYIEMPVPKIMSSCADKIKVYQVDDSYPNFVESKVSASENGSQSISFTASELSTYIFVAPSPAKDNSSSGSKDAASGESSKKNSASKDKSSDDKDKTAPAADEDTSSANADKNSTPAVSEDTSSADDKSGSTPASSEDTSSADDNSGSTPTAAVDTSSANAVENDNTPAATEDTSSADIDESINAPAATALTVDSPSANAVGDNNTPAPAAKDTSSAEGEKNTYQTGYEYIPYTNNVEASGSDKTNTVSEDVSSAAGAYASSAPMETAAMPVSGGTAPIGEAPEKLRLSTKKRRYRIINKRKLDDMVFVL